MLPHLYQTEPEHLPLPDDSFLVRNCLMKWVKTARCPSLSMNAFWLLNTWMLEFERRILTFKLEVKLRAPSAILVSVEKTHDIFAYTVWYVWQLKFMALRQTRKLWDEEAKKGRILFWNQLRTKVSFCSSAWLKLEIRTSPRASRACDSDGLLLLGACNWEHHIS